jgi:hypothetical protein
VVTLNYFNNYIYTYTKYIYIYIYNINSSLYFFSSNNTYKNIWVDTDFYLNTSSWYTNTLNLKPKRFSCINNTNKFCRLTNFSIENYNNSDIIKLYENKQLIEIFFTENNNQKKDEIYKELLQKIDTQSINYINTINFFLILNYTVNHKRSIKDYTYGYMSFYKYFYKKLIPK